MIDAHHFTFDKLSGDGAWPLDAWRGKTILVVNTASQCGFTKQYAGLQDLWHRYRARGLIILGVPCDDFGGQEPGSPEEIQIFCSRDFGVDFPLTAKYHVTGKHAHPFYAWANEWAGFIGSPKWNFHKYLVGPSGGLVDWFSSVTAPDDPKIIEAIDTLLNEEPAS